MNDKYLHIEDTYKFSVKAFFRVDLDFEKSAYPVRKKSGRRKGCRDNG